MKTLSFFLALSIGISTSYAQDITGKWHGLLKVQGTQLRIDFNISKDEKGYTSTMDSPDQKAFGLPVTSTSFENSVLKLSIETPKIEFEGTLGANQEIVGNFKQSGFSFPMTLSKEKVEIEVPKRPQEPQQPYPYYAEDITFENKTAGIELAGTLTLPEKNGVYPAVILISGSGAQNRNEELLGHKPFLVLADFLTRNGIAVLRFDDRGTAASKGNFATATSLDFSTDVEAALAYLQSRKEINQKKIGLIGHSEGGLIAPIVASRSKGVAFIVLLAGPGQHGADLLLLQQELIGKTAGLSDELLQKQKMLNQGAYQIVDGSTGLEKLKTDLSAYYLQELKNFPPALKPNGMSDEQFTNLMVNQITSPWMQYFLKSRPQQYLEKVKCPVLAINGAKDLQVAPKENLEAIKTALKKGKNKKSTIKELPGLNHLFQECTTGSPTEYAQIEQTISPLALSTILDWLKIQVK